MSGAGGNQRRRVWLLLVCSAAFLAAVAIGGALLAEPALVTDFSRKNLAPCWAYPFGTDQLGRDMFLRTLTGLSLSIRLGLLTAGVSTALAFLLGTLAAVGGKLVDAAVSWLIDLLLGIPHLLLLLLISYACGRGFFGVVLGISLTHWPTLCRVIRGEVLQLRQSGYVRVAARLGESQLRIITWHLLPHLLPQLAVGLVLTFPHAILHEAAVTFLGFGLPPEQPALGIILSESMQYLALGRWWLALFPGALLLLTVLLFDRAGSRLRALIDPASAHR